MAKVSQTVFLPRVRCSGLAGGQEWEECPPSGSLEGQLVAGAMVNVTQPPSPLCFLWWLFEPLLKHVQQSRTNWRSHSEISAFHTFFFQRFLKPGFTLPSVCGCSANSCYMFVFFYKSCACIYVFSKNTSAFFSDCAILIRPRKF